MAEDPVICEVVQSALCLISGLNVLTAFSGQVAIDLLGETRPDLVLMDAMMPGLDLPATFKRMRESNLIDGIPVIFLTSTVLPAEIEHFVRLGVLGVIGKPFDPLSLGGEVIRLWKGHAAAHGTAGVPDGIANVGPRAETLATRFLRRTREDIEKMRALVLRASNGDTTVLRESERLCHSMHGASAMFGYPKISMAAGALERLVGQISRSPAPLLSPGSPTLEDLIACTEELAAVHTATSQATPENCMFQD